MRKMTLTCKKEYGIHKNKLLPPVKSKNEPEEPTKPYAGSGPVGCLCHCIEVSSSIAKKPR